MQLLEMHAVISGRVQGVGFRATVRHMARRDGLTGTVENLPNGSVEIYAQGTKVQLEQLLQSIKSEFHVQSIETQFFEIISKKLSFNII